MKSTFLFTFFKATEMECLCLEFEKQASDIADFLNTESKRNLLSKNIYGINDSQNSEERMFNSLNPP